MSSLKTYLAGLLLGGALTAHTSSVQAFSADEQLRFFAQCAGRLSAQMEFQWMFDGAASERTKIERQDVIDILDTMIPDDRGREVLHWRIEAKHAQAVLLHTSTFGQNQRQSQMAAKLALRHMNECRALMIS
jgi:hypothetical protein